MLRELRFAMRMGLKQPGFSLIAIPTLALGIGATSGGLLCGGVGLTMSVTQVQYSNWDSFHRCVPESFSSSAA